MKGYSLTIWRRPDRTWQWRIWVDAEERPRTSGESADPNMAAAIAATVFRALIGDREGT